MTSALVIWSARRGEWLPCVPDEITWLDRTLLSDGRDQSLHRPPRCPGLRFVHHRWELFSRDTTHQVYLAPFIAGTKQDYHDVRQSAQHTLPVARAALEAQPARLDAGAWLVGVGKWVLPICVDVTPDGRDNPTVPVDASMPATRDISVHVAAAAAQIQPVPDAVERVAGYFKRNQAARLAMAYYFQEFIRGEFAPHAAPIADVAVALDLSNEAAVSEYKKELQRRIWNEQGHQRELSEFLLLHGLLTDSDLDEAIRTAAQNAASGRAEQARQRLRYRNK